jgi:hypothetical protein
LTLLCNSRLQIPTFPMQRVSFEHTRHGNINPLLRNIEAEQVFPQQQILATVNCWASLGWPNRCDWKINLATRCLIFSLHISVKTWILTARSESHNSQATYEYEESRIVDKLQVTTRSQSVSSQPSGGEDIKGPPRDIRGSELIVKERL